MTAAVASTPARTAGRLRRWLSVRHPLRAEAVVVLALYGAYELARGLVVGDADAAVRNAHEVVALERSLRVFFEAEVQGYAQSLPGLIDLLSISYLTLHLAGTAAVLLWLHQHRPTAFPRVRTTLLLASGLALVGYLVFPTAPPRSAGIGIVDTVSGAHVDLDAGLVSSLYNPYAAVPSMHVGYALVVAASLIRYARRPALRFLVGPLYPLYVLLVVVATGKSLPPRRTRRCRGDEPCRGGCAVACEPDERQEPSSFRWARAAGRPPRSPAVRGRRDHQPDRRLARGSTCRRRAGYAGRLNM